MSTIAPKKPLGLILREAGLISIPQLELALQDQIRLRDLRIGEILALRGWLKQQTADFFAEEWPQLLIHRPHQPISYYLKAAGLLNEQQIQSILNEQPVMAMEFGAMAVLKGLIKKATLSFFIEHLCEEEESDYVTQVTEIIEYCDDSWRETITAKREIYIGEPQITVPDDLRDINQKQETLIETVFLT
ncbi:hypothetical protein PCC7424_4551 [Gloeothece citriformis PCC 7424]|uniref:Type II secretion system protein GspE N-terminal domain-containing protein n=1 Tax=Gloeothece citriformis (strain PCC 7424) TaxID=65393 RepID=B7KAE0_GLOC7|nr:hypothetical protein [Gloeothece citriformis]ACK72914.1 hypothetical protein PCC7424_4551 [Gloeothece citriformis PCC 7424]